MKTELVSAEELAASCKCGHPRVEHGRRGCCGWASYVDSKPCTCRRFDMGGATHDADAALIAAAPEMLEVLRLLDHAVDRQTGHVSIGAVQTAAIAARAVIAKATGGAK